MTNQPAIFSRVVAFCIAILSNGWGIAGIISTALTYAVPLLSNKLGDRLLGWFSTDPARRRTIFFTVAIVLLLTACFQAYDALDQASRKALAQQNDVERSIRASARIVVTRLTLVPADTTSEPRYSINIEYQNQGSVAAIGVQVIGLFNITDHILTASEQADGMAAMLRQSSNFHISTEANEIQPQQSFKILTETFSNADTQDVINRKRFANAFVVFKYLDASTPGGKARLTEVCAFINGSDFNFYPTHNRISLAKN